MDKDSALSSEYPDFRVQGDSFSAAPTDQETQKNTEKASQAVKQATKEG